MRTLREVILEAESRHVAVGHFNISERAGLKAIATAAHELKLPVIIGVSEGEGKFIELSHAAAAVRALREHVGMEVYLNSDHTHDLKIAKRAAELGFDAVLFDAGKLPLEENIAKTREAVETLKKINPDILVEGELGYIGSGSNMLEALPEGAAIEEKDLTKPEDIALFVKKTGVDLVGPAVGNIHGMFKHAPNPHINVNRIQELREAGGVPLVLHGGSGIRDEEFKTAIDAGISVVHINTEIRVAWRKGLEEALKEHPDEITPYKLLPKAVDYIQAVVTKRLKLFNGMA